MKSSLPSIEVGPQTRSDLLRIVITIITIIAFLFWRFQYGMNRYFDIDEFAHLHWSYNTFLGYRPYTDFFYFFPPLFLYVFFPLFWLIGKSVSILIVARGLSFGIFLISSVVLFFLTKRVKGANVAWLTILLFSFLPIPSDKWIEIRPDLIGILVGLLGMYFLVRGLKEEKAGNFFLTGFFYTTSVLIVPKFIFQFFVAGGIIVFYLLWLKKEVGKVIKPLIFGMIVPSVITFLFLVSYGDLGKSVFLFTKVATEATRVLGSKFPIPANFFFYPNDIYYGAPGMSLPYVANLIIWMAAIIAVVLSVVSFLDEKDKGDCLIKMLLSSTLLINLLTYIHIFPLKHSQYLLPISPFIAYYFALFIEKIIEVSEKIQRVGKIFENIFLLGIIILILLSGREMYRWKLSWPKMDFSYYSRLFGVLPEKEKVYDLTGEAIFSPDGYYFCCIPYGQYEEALTFPIPSLEKELRKNRVKFINIQYDARLSVIPAINQQVIKRYYTVYPLGNPPFLMVAGTMIEFEKGEQEKEIDIIAGGNYRFFWNNGELLGRDVETLLRIDGKRVSSMPLYLAEGKHLITASDKGILKVMYRW